MKVRLILIFSLLLTIKNLKSQNPEPGEILNRARFSELTGFLERSGSSSLMILQNGKVLYEWGDTTKKITVHSMRKTLLNSLYGIAVARGVIDTSMTLGELKIKDNIPLSGKEPEARIADLLRSRSGVYLDAAGVGKGRRESRPSRHSYEPGEHFYYNNWDFNVLGAILDEQTGTSLFTFFFKEIAIPIGMQDYQGSYTTINGESTDSKIPDTDAFYQFEKSRSKYPIQHFRLSGRDLARFGQLYLNNGYWKGKSIIPEKWIKASIKPYSIYDIKNGIAYGMLWNVLMETKERPDKAFFHTGTSVHLLGVYPAQNLVLVHRVDTEKEYNFGGKEFSEMINLVFTTFK